MSGFEAAFAETNITPELGTPMSGLFHHREATSVVDDLRVKALVMTDGTVTLAMVVCDLISIPRILANSAKSLISDRSGIPASSVMILATHTHTGPLLDFGPEDPGLRLYQDRGTPYRNAQPAANGMLTAVLDPGYREWIATRIADAVAMAHEHLQPATVAIGSTTVDDVCFNRRFHMRDGTVVFNPGLNNPDIVREAGSTDPEIVSFLIESLDHKPLALWSTLSLHYVGTDSDDAISADYYGHFTEEIQRVLGCPGILANGTSGNINHVNVRQAPTLSGDSRSRAVAKTVAAAAMSSVITGRRERNVRLGSRLEEIEIDRYHLTSSDLDIATAVVAGEGARQRTAGERYSFEIGQRLPDQLDFSWSSDLIRLARMPEQAWAEVQVFMIGNLAIAALPGEVFVEFGLDLKDQSPFEKTAVLGLSNGHVGYLPTLDAFAQGGYETWRSRANWTAQGTGERLAASAGEALQSLFVRGDR